MDGIKSTAMPMKAAENKINDLVARLPAAEADKLYDELDALAEDTPDRRAVRRALADKLNAQRRQHARRLFTELFQPFLTHDTNLLRAEFGATGVLHPMDVGALWVRLAQGGLQSLARKADTDLGDLASNRPLRSVFRQPAVQALRTEMMGAAIKTLPALLSAQAPLRTLLEEMNRWRHGEAKRMRLGFEPRALQADDLRLMLGILQQQAALIPLMEQMRRAARDTHSLSSLLADMETGVLTKAGLPATGAALILPLVLVHEDMDYDAGRLTLTYGPLAWQEPTLIALVRHLGRACFVLTEEIGLVLGTGQVVRAGLSLPPPRQDNLNRELGRLDKLLGLFDDLDVISHPRYGGQVRDFLDRMVRRIESELYPVLVERCTAEGRAINRPIADFEALDWLLDFCTRWRNVLKRSLFWGTGFTEFYDHVMEVLRDAHHGCFVRAGYSDAAHRLDHAIRLAQLGARLGADTSTWAGLMDQGLVRTVTERLAAKEPLTEGETAFITAVLDMAQKELRRTRHWKDATLQAFAELAESRLRPA